MVSYDNYNDYNNRMGNKVNSKIAVSLQVLKMYLRILQLHPHNIGVMDQSKQ